MIVESLIKIVSDFITKYSYILIRMAVSGDRREIRDRSHKDHFVSQIDIELHKAYRMKLGEILSSFIYASEEGAPKVYPPDCEKFPEYLVIVDPLDTSELAVRGLCGYTHVLVYSLKEQTPIAAVVGDMFHSIQMFYAFRDGDGNNNAYLMTRNRDSVPIKASQEKKLDKALVTNYSMRPLERFKKIAAQDKLIDTLAKPDENGEKQGRIGLDFGSVGLCHVAAGFSDAMIEIAKGFSPWDLYPGQYILHAAGGTAVSLDGIELPLDLDVHSLEDVEAMMKKRQKFIAAGTPDLLTDILAALRLPVDAGNV